MIGYDEPLSRQLNLYMERGEKIAMVGANGIGKTTLLKSILGLIPAVSGKVTLGDYLSIGYFEQEMAPGNTTTCIDEIWKEFPSYTQYQVRSALAKCGLTTQHIESQVRVLSGGEQAKVRLCKLINRETNLLLLDEPTNHLDVEAKEELKRALAAYKGNILLICHEPDFYEGFATKVWDCSEWSLKIYEKNVFQRTPTFSIEPFSKVPGTDKKQERHRLRVDGVPVFLKLGMVGIYKKEIGLGGPDDLYRPV